MEELKKGDIVARKSYGCDILFKVVDISTNENNEKIVRLRGIECRLEADAHESDLVIQK